MCDGCTKPPSTTLRYIRAQVTVPIKIRAVMKGVVTGWADLYGKEDNSWWVSFGQSGALTWVRIWLQFVIGLMGITQLIAIIHLIIKAFSGLGPLLEAIMPLLTAIITCAAAARCCRSLLAQPAAARGCHSLLLAPPFLTTRTARSPDGG